MPVVMSFSTAQVIDSTNSGLDGMSVKVIAVWPGAAVSAVSSAASAGAVRFAHMRPVSSREMSFFMIGVLSETGGRVMHRKFPQAVDKNCLQGNTA